MALPKLDTITYSTTLPLTNKDVKFRPFQVKEQKVLMTAIEAKNYETQVNAVKQIVNNCTFGEVDIQKLPKLDIEWMFIQLRSKSVGEKHSLSFRCNETLESGETCNHRTSFEVDLNDIRVEKDDNHQNTIMLNESIGIKMKYPGFDLFTKISDIDENTDTEKLADLYYDAIMDCIECVFEGDKVYDDFTKEELKEFVESLDTKTFSKLKDFFQTIPELVMDVEVTCSNCGNTNQTQVKGIENFLS